MFTQLLNRVIQAKKGLWLFPYRLRSQKIISGYLRNNTNCVKVNIGCGAHLLPGWLNAEVWPYTGTVYIDVSRRLPFLDESVHFINCEHLVEHLDYQVSLHFLRECFRVLGENGVLRISTPNLKRLIQIYQGNSTVSGDEILAHHRQYHQRPSQNICAWFNDHLRLWGHQFLFDEPTLIDLLKQVGFTQIIPCEFGKSEHPELKDIERHDEDVSWMRSAYIMTFEASKIDL